MSRQKKKVCYADFETTQENDNNEVRVYSWALSHDIYLYDGNSIETFFETLDNLSVIVYFHNLKFDGSYIIHYLLKNNIEFEVCEKMGTYYSIKYDFIEFRDTFNYLPMSLDKLTKIYCKNNYKYKLNDYEKTYNYLPCIDDIKYNANDVLSLKEGFTNFLSITKKLLKDNGVVDSLESVGKKLTASGMAWDVFKELSNLEKISVKTTRQEYNKIVESYKGGFVYSKNGTYENVVMLDENSMYPDKYRNYPMPIGKGVEVEETELDKFNFYILCINIKYELKENYIPIIGGGFSKFGAIRYKTSSDGLFEELTITNYDFKLIRQFYEIEYTYNWGVGYNTVTGLFAKYCDIFMNIKENSDGEERHIAKLMLNMPYGKSAMSGKNEIKRYYLKDNSVKSEIVNIKLEDDQLNYLPVGIAITSYARYDLLTTALNIGFDRVVYMDTDSIKYINSDKPIIGLKMDDRKLGFWKNEGVCEVFKTIGLKRYIYYSKGKIGLACAGFDKDNIIKSLDLCNENVCVNCFKYKIKKFKNGFKVLCKQSRITKGGRLIKNIEKEIKS